MIFYPLLLSLTMEFIENLPVWAQIVGGVVVMIGGLAFGIKPKDMFKIVVSFISLKKSTKKNKDSEKK